MVKSKELTYKLLPEWSITQQEKSLIISGGADARYEIELENDEPSFFATVKPNAPFTRSKLEERDSRVLEELVTAEIVAPLMQKKNALKVGVIGDANKLTLATQKDTQTADLLLIVRVNSTYAKLLEKINYRSIAKPHLFVDMAFHHTFSLGPLVFPGETACIACLQGRIGTRWGDDLPPTSPKVSDEYPGVVSELISIELNRISHNNTSLTNKTVSWNFHDRTIKVSQLLKVPLCPICAQNRVDPIGSLILPWSKDEGTANTV